MGQGNMGQDDGQYYGHHSHPAAPSGDDRSAATHGPGDAFDGVDLLDIRLGDLMRGERATLGKSLLDVERELKIRATYIAAIENGDVGAFSSPGFIAGYVRSYARYLNMNADWTFRRFCEETGFQGVHGLSATQQIQKAKRHPSPIPQRLDPNDVMSGARISYTPMREPLFSGIEPGALGSAAVLIALVVGLGYGAWAVLTDIQRVQIAPIDEAPATLAELDPLAGATEGAFDVPQSFDIQMPGPETLERLYRPTPLEAPVLVPRDGAIATLNPDAVGTLPGAGTAAPPPRSAPQLAANVAAAPLTVAPRVEPDPEPARVQVTETRNDETMIFAVRETWVRVTSANGVRLFEGVLQPGEFYTVPDTAEPPILRTGNAGGLYFAVNGVPLGPSGAGGVIEDNIILSADALSSTYTLANPDNDPDLPVVAELVLGTSQ